MRLATATAWVAENSDKVCGEHGPLQWDWHKWSEEDAVWRQSWASNMHNGSHRYWGPEMRMLTLFPARQEERG
eukprot:7352360-Pyramimonas_sp.AAC.1